jgi:hypothetical protein
MVAHPHPLIEILAEIPDFRSNRGKCHPFAASLALACGARRKEVVAGVTSSGSERANAARLLALVRGHWQTEKQSH